MVREMTERKDDAVGAGLGPARTMRIDHAANEWNTNKRISNTYHFHDDGYCGTWCRGKAFTTRITSGTSWELGMEGKVGLRSNALPVRWGLGLAVVRDYIVVYGRVLNPPVQLYIQIAFVVDPISGDHCNHNDGC